MRKTIYILMCLTVGQPAVNAADRAKPPVVITAPAKLTPRGKWVYLTVTDAEHTYELPWAMPPHYGGSVALESNRVYTFTIVEEPFRGGLLIPNVVRVEREGKMIYDREVCEVHHVKMGLKEARIVYGLIVPGLGEPTGEMEQRLFPHRREISFGGCVVTQDSPKAEKIYVCSECKKAYEKWKSQNPKTK